MQNVLKINGETVVDSEQTIGYIHRAFEKIAEHRPFYQVTPLTDRLELLFLAHQQLWWHATVEKLMGVEVPKRVDYMRIIISELARIADHLICNSVIGVDMGALTGFTYVFQSREKIYEIYEGICGARLTTNIGRIGGFERDFSPDVHKKIREFLKEYPEAACRIQQKCWNVTAFLWTVPSVWAAFLPNAPELRLYGPQPACCGRGLTCRVMTPYSSYQDFDFTILIGTQGDVYDRFMVRNRRNVESLKLIQNALDNLPEGQLLCGRTRILPASQRGRVHKNGSPDLALQNRDGRNRCARRRSIPRRGRRKRRTGVLPRERRWPRFVTACTSAALVLFTIRHILEMIRNSSISDAVMTMSSINVIAGELDA